jgi:hypothetical protein
MNTVRNKPLKYANHYLNDPANDEFAALVAAGGKEYMKVMLAVLPPFKLVKNPLRERSRGKERRSISEYASNLPNVRVDNSDLL